MLIDTNTLRLILNSSETLKKFGQCYLKLHVPEIYTNKKATDEQLQKIGMYLVKTILGEEVNISNSDAAKYLVFAKKLKPQISETILGHKLNTQFNFFEKNVTILQFGETFEKIERDLLKVGIGYRDTPAAINLFREAFLKVLDLYKKQSKDNDELYGKWSYCVGRLMCEFSSMYSNNNNLQSRYKNAFKSQTIDLSEVAKIYQGINKLLDEMLANDPLDLDKEPTCRLGFYN